MARQVKHSSPLIGAVPLESATHRNSSLGARVYVLLRLAVLISLISVLILAAGWFVNQWLDKPVKRVAVQGDFVHLGRDAVAQQIRSALTDGFLTINLEAIRSLLKQDPWVDDVSIERRWPDTLVVTVLEHQPIARWGASGVLNHRGEVIELPSDRVSAEKMAGLPLLEGPKEASEDVMRRYQETMRSLGPLGLKVTSLRCSENHSWEMGIGSATLILGRDRIPEKIGHFLLVYQRHLRDRWEQVETVDLRYQQGLAVDWRST